MDLIVFCFIEIFLLKHFTLIQVFTPRMSPKIFIAHLFTERVDFGTEFSTISAHEKSGSKPCAFLFCSELVRKAVPKANNENYQHNS